MKDYKFSIRLDGHSGISITLKEGPGNFKPGESINHYHYKCHYEEMSEEKEVIEEILKCIHEIRVPKYYETGDYGNQPDFYTWLDVDRNYERREK